MCVPIYWLRCDSDGWCSLFVPWWAQKRHQVFEHRPATCQSAPRSPASYHLHELGLISCRTCHCERHTSHHRPWRKGTENHPSRQYQWVWLILASCHSHMQGDSSDEICRFGRRKGFPVGRRRGTGRPTIHLIPPVWRIQSSCHGGMLVGAVCKTYLHERHTALLQDQRKGTWRLSNH